MWCDVMLFPDGGDREAPLNVGPWLRNHTGVAQKFISIFINIHRNLFDALYCVYFIQFNKSTTKFSKYFINIFFHGSAALVGLNFLHEDPRSHSDTPHLIGLLWTSDQPVAEPSTWQHTTVTRDRHLCPWWDSKQAVIDPRLRPRGHRDRRINKYIIKLCLLTDMTELWLHVSANIDLIMANYSGHTKWKFISVNNDNFTFYALI
jgi:hypothetical protein